jgi:hypothetical protein
MLIDGQDYGHYAMGLCPYHDDHNPSLQVTDRGYKCKSCGAKGSLEDLQNSLGHTRYKIIEQVKDKPTRKSMFPGYDDLDAICDMLLSAHDRLMSSSHLHYYLQKRGVDDLSELCKLGWYNNMYTIPVLDKAGGLVGGIARAGSNNTDKKLRFDTPHGQPPMLYVPDWKMLEQANYVFLTFGIFDALTVRSLGFASCTPTVGKDSVNPRWFDEINKRIYIIPDKGEERDALMLVSRLGLRGRILEINYDGTNTKDPNDYATTVGKGKLRELLQAAGG